MVQLCMEKVVATMISCFDVNRIGQHCDGHLMVHNQGKCLRQLIDSCGCLEEVRGCVKLSLLLDLLLQEGACAGQRLCPHRCAMSVHIRHIHLQYYSIPLHDVLPLQ